MNRQTTLNAIQNNPKISVLIIGGGINGVGTFRDLALQDVDVLLVERGDFGSGTSSASSHMVHGGVRYLENGEFRLVRESVEERNRLLKNAPHLVTPLATTIPLFKAVSGLLNAPLKFLNLRDRPGERGAAVIKAGLTMYDAFTRDAAVPKHDFISRKKSLEKFPQMNKDIIATATYYDAAMPSPERILLEVLLDGLESGGKAVNYLSAVSASPNTVLLRDEQTGNTFAVQPDLVINAAGPWIDFANDALGKKTKFIGGTKGSHIVLDNPELLQAIGGNEIFFENDDGRITLIYPFKKRVMLGTSDLRIDSPDDARCTDEEIDYFIKLGKKVFPNINISREQIVFSFSGTRPLPANDEDSTLTISRDHSTKIIEPSKTNAYPIFNLIGGKWTTFRAFSEQVTDKVLALLSQARQANTQALPIGGGKDYPTDIAAQDRWLNKLREETDIPWERLEQLFDRYGTRAVEFALFIANGNDKPLTSHADYSEREILYLAIQEHVVHLDDLLLRRTLLAMQGEVTLAMVEELATLLAPTLGWQVADEVARTVEIFADRHQVTLN